MKSKTLILFLVLTFIIQACNLPSNVPGTETPTEEPTVVPSATQPPPTATATNTPPPTDTPPPTLTSTPTIPIAFPKDVSVNCRFGPGTEWAVLSGLVVGQSSQIIGKSADFNWWYIVDPLNASRNCWVAASVTNTAGNLAPIPVVETPKATVTSVSVKITPADISVAGCVGPISPSKIEGTIETNGPTTVKWYFETQQSGAMSTQTTEFTEAGSKTVSADYTPSVIVGTYWVRLIVTSPNSIQSETKYEIKCP
ncbi:MAG: hypothetical protein C3F07_19825 [Anaerolineales bacterium]|nr:MAG: hypothetical protein C3F07_19825 [Anaerolineales bacterium]